MDYQSEIREFLNSRVNDQKNCKLCFIFGSIAKGSVSPNDCDLFWLTEYYPESKEWTSLQVKISKLKNEFLKAFKIPLNVLVYTLDEYNENSEFKKRIFERPRIIIKTAYNNGYK